MISYRLKDEIKTIIEIVASNHGKDPELVLVSIDGNTIEFSTEEDDGLECGCKDIIVFYSEEFEQ